ncbi:hypothetical protein [Brevundimonas sp. NIBR11]|uniref:hypothetical protein n=1 Tax=Brevundimonas sp. NIBR11 TaxID=3015999 RepID=UPI0022EFF753|nr:hypothetical protein [Brevundimonas sp. NIBR11]WGM30639.1 hypothetical protein KKHFBJBL_00866 [Brevundimonas sp. NIBR11]
MLFIALVSALALQDPPPAYPPTPQRFPDRQSAFIQGTLNIAIGERATLRANADGTYDLIGVDRIQIGDVMPPAAGSTATINEAEAGTLRFSLHANQDVGSILKVENSHSEGLAYSGFVVRFAGGQAQGPEATSVCTVPPGMANFEHWPEPVIQVVIGSLRKSEDTVPTCPPHIDPAPEAEVDALTEEGIRLGRFSTLFALCAPYYGTDLAVGHRLADDFERRTQEAGWADGRLNRLYSQGRDLERAEVGVVMDASGVTPQQARRHLREMFPRLKTRCQYLAQQVPGSISDVREGDRRLDATARQYR